jgi:hypothetical protein
MDQNKEDYDDGPVLRWRWRPPRVDYRRRLLRLCWQGPVLIALLAAVQAVGWVDGLFRWRPGSGWWLVAAVAASLIVNAGLGYLCWRAQRRTAASR